MKNLYNPFKTLMFICLVALAFVGKAQQINEGPVQLQIRADAFWKGVYDDVIQGTEERDKVWFKTNADVNNLGWVGGSCFQWNGPSSGFPVWSGAFNSVVYNSTFNTNVPLFYNVQLEGWEEDSGGDCSFDGPCSICIDPDDNHCGPAQIGGNVDFRAQGAPCAWSSTPAEVFGTGGCQDYGVRVSTYYTPPVPTVSGNLTGCGSVTVTASGAVYGGGYEWYTAASGGSPIFTGNPFTVNTIGTNTYYVGTQNGCPSLGRRAVTVTVTANGNPAYTYSSATYCKNAGTNPTPVISGTPGGTFTSAPAGLSINGNSGLINLAASNVGTYTITYTTPGTCQATLQQTVQIVAADNATFNYSAPSFCQGSSAQSPTIGGVNGGTFSATPLGLSINPNNGVLNLNASVVGTYNVTYLTPGPCPTSSTQQVVVNPSQNATFNYSSTIYCQDDNSQPTPNIAGTLGGTFSVLPSGLIINPATGAVDLPNSTPGQYVITYGTPGPCAVSNTTAITVVDNPTSPVAASPAPICFGDAIPQLTAAGLGGTINWYNASTGGNLLQSNSSVYNPSINAPGTYTYYAEEVGQASCASSRTAVTVVVNPTPTAPTATQPNPICIGQQVPTLSASGSNVQFDWYNQVIGGTLLQANNSNYTPIITQPGTYVYYVEGVGSGNCSSARTPVVLTVYSLPALAIATSDLTLCANDNPVPLFGFPGNGSMSGAGVSGNIFNPTGLPAGPSTVTYTYTDVNSCTNTANETFTIYAVPNPIITTSSSTVLCNGGTVTLDAGAGYTSYAWLPNGELTQTAIANGDGVYGVTVTSTDGCVGTSSTPVTVQLVPDTFAAGPSINNVTVFCIGTNINTLLDAGTGYSSYNWQPGNIGTQTLNVTAPGTYVVTVTNLGCTFVDSVDVGFSTVSANIIADGPLLFCLGDSVNLTVNPAYSYQWSSGSTTQDIEVNHSDWYSVLVEDQYGCQATDSVQVTVDFPPVADFNYGQQSNSLLMSFFDFSMNSTSYSWNFGDNSALSTDANPQHNFPLPGNYTVTLTVTNSCGSDVITQVVPVKVVSVPELAIEQFTLYPNPTDGMLQIRFNSTISQAIDIRVMNAVGQLLFSDAVNNFSGTYQKSYDLSTLPSGIYMFQIVTEKGTRTERVIVSR